uniref:KH domain-containing protein At4g18375 n=1 Tax=Anthurium amnicola TaxID=1678845 RepID=A0A1D1ZGL4_9ARAE
MFKSSKRPFVRNPLETNGKGKWQKTAHFGMQQNKLKPAPGSIVFRILCPASKSGSVIGKGGGIITKIRQETGAKIRIEETVPGCEERVVVITGPDKEIEDRNEQTKEDDPYIDDADEDDDAKENDDEEKEHHPRETTHSEKGTSAAQKALLLVFERIAENEAESDPLDEENKKSSCVVRLLILSSQVGCLLGKGGSVIKQMASESGALIRILSRDKIPACASPLDELVQITGGIDAVRKALQSISQQLLANPPRDRDLLLPDKIPGPSSHPFAPLPQLGISRAEVLPPSNYHLPDQGPPFSTRPHEIVDFHQRMAPSISKFPEIAGPVKVPVSPELLTFRLICTSDKVGSVIGKGGNIVKIIQSETGCEIKIVETVPDSEDRVVVITGPAHPDDRISPVQDAVLRVQNRIVMAVPDHKENSVSTRVIVSSNQTGCLLGKGGSIVAEMRKLSGAQIRILSKDQLPKYASENEVVVQVSGKFEAVQEALVQITSRLKHHIFSEKFPALGHLGRPTFADQVPQFPSFMGRRERSPPGLYSNLAPSFRKFDHIGVLPPLDERSGFPRTHYTSGAPPHSSERIPSSAPWAPQGISGGDGSIGVDENTGAPQRLGGFAGGNQLSANPNATVDVVVPRAIVPIIRGEDGGCLKQICEISGANITITDPRPGAPETIVIISGTPDQTHAAQSLIQAFVLSESGSS